MKVVITIEDGRKKGNVKAKMEFVPGITPRTRATPATSIAIDAFALISSKGKKP